MSVETVLDLDYYGRMDDDWRIKHFIEEECDIIYKDNECKIVKSPDNELFYVLGHEVLAINTSLKSVGLEVY